MMNRFSLRCRAGFLLVLTLAVGLSSLISARAQGRFGPPSDLVTVQNPAPVALKAGGKTTASFKLMVKTGYHIQANPASDKNFIATELKLSSSGGVQVGKIVYPPARSYQFKMGDQSLTLKVYEGTVALQVPLSLAAGTKPSVVTLHGTLLYQACNDQSCFAPKTVPIALTVKVNGAGGSGKSEQTGAAPLAPAVNSPSVPAASGNSGGDAMRIQKQFGVVSLPDVVFLNANGKERADLRLGQGTAENLTRDDMKARLAALKSGTPFETQSQGGLMQRFKNASLPLQLVLAFVGGLLLNLTPCVYPMIPITVGYFGAQSEGQLGRTLTLGLLYVLGLATVYSLLGVVAALTGGLFGAALQSPWVTGFVAVVLALLALSMLGVFTIQPPTWLMSRGGAKKGALGALGMGAMLGVVAAPCVGPFVAALLAYVGLKGQALLGFALFFALSVGLGLPYLLLGAFSGSIKALPRSGKWMETSKKIFAVPLLVAALYYGYFALAPLATKAAPSTTQTTGSEAWKPATLAAIQQARAQGKPAVIDFRANWCVPCLALEANVFSQPDVLSSAQGVTLLRADLTTAGS